MHQDTNEVCPHRVQQHLSVGLNDLVGTLWKLPRLLKAVMKVFCSAESPFSNQGVIFRFPFVNFPGYSASPSHPIRQNHHGESSLLGFWNRNLQTNTPLKTNMTLENPHFQQEIHLQMVGFLLPCQFSGGGGMYNEFPINGVDDGLCVCVSLSTCPNTHLYIYLPFGEPLNHGIFVAMLRHSHMKLRLCSPHIKIKIEFI